jgi:hypothetical protein
MESSINGNKLNAAFTKEQPKVKDSFDAMQKGITTTFEDPDLKALITDSGVITKTNAHASDQLKASRVDAEIINNARGPSAQDKSSGSSLEGLLKSTPETEVKGITEHTGPN